MSRHLLCTSRLHLGLLLLAFSSVLCAADEVAIADSSPPNAAEKPVADSEASKADELSEKLDKRSAEAKAKDQAKAAGATDAEAEVEAKSAAEVKVDALKEVREGDTPDAVPTPDVAPAPLSEAASKEAAAADVSAADVQQSDVDVMSMDVASSIDDAVNQKGLFKISGDIRGGYYWTDTKARDGSSDRDDQFSARARLESKFSPLETLRLTARLAMQCSTKGCDPGTTLSSDSIDSGTLEPGDITLDELFVQWFRTERFNVAVGRLQTRFVTRGGVFAKSLDRNNSNNTNINWTDGIHAEFNPGYGKGWRLHLISEYNDKDGSSSIRRAPLNFETSDSRYSHFVAFQNNQRWGFIVQRGLDISFLPDALLEDGTLDGRRKDYWGFVGRTAARIPLGTGLERLQLAGEFGYAPNTPTESAVDIDLGSDSDDDTGGVAWNVSASLMDILPNQSIGLLYGQTQAGWLLSPQFENNQRQIELRYSWRPDPNLILDARLRQRKDIDRLSGSSRSQEKWNFFLRATVRFSGESIRFYD